MKSETKLSKIHCSHRYTAKPDPSSELTKVGSTVSQEERSL